MTFKPKIHGALPISPIIRLWVAQCKSNCYAIEYTATPHLGIVCMFDGFVLRCSLLICIESAKASTSP